MKFAGVGRPISSAGLGNVSDQLGVGLPEIWSVLKVETRGCGFLADRRPQILFERHVFHRETGGRFDATAPDISNEDAGGYGPGGSHQYDRLEKAIALDRRAALRSASWGIGQVMGFNAESVGFSDVEAMVARMQDSEDEQLGAMFRYVETNGLGTALKKHDWATFARGYNGSNFKENNYDEKLATAHAGYVARGVPDVTVRSAQVFLSYRGIDPGPIDGQMGNRTRTALRTFQERTGLPATGEPDDETLAALAQA